MKKERRPEASSILDIVRSGIEAGADDDRLTACINDILTCLIHSAVEEEREACAAVADHIAAFLKDNKLSNTGDVEVVAVRIRARSKS